MKKVKVVSVSGGGHRPRVGGHHPADANSSAVTEQIRNRQIMNERTTVAHTWEGKTASVQTSQFVLPFFFSPLRETHFFQVHAGFSITVKQLFESSGLERCPV